MMYNYVLENELKKRGIERQRVAPHAVQFFSCTPFNVPRYLHLTLMTSSC